MDPNQSEHLRNSLSGNQSACSRTSTERNRERERSVRGISPHGPHSHLLLLAEKEREKGSRRSIDTQNKLNGILNRRGRSRSTSTDGKFSGLPPRTTKPVTSANMKSLLMESSAGGFQGLQLETVDPVFFKNSRSSAVSSPSSSSSSSSYRLRGPFRDDLESSPSVTISAGVSLSVSVKEKEKVKVKVKRGSLESLGAIDVESRTATDTTATTFITAKSNAVDELLIWKKGMPVSDKDQVDNSCPSTPSTVADPHTSLDHDNEFNSLAQAYGDSYPSYTLLPMEDGSVFAGLNQAPSDIEGLSAVPPPEESLAYSAYSASDTHTRDIISPKGTNYFTRKLSARSTSLLGNVYDNVTARIGSIFTAVTSGSTLLDIKIPILSSDEAVSVSRAALIDVNVKKEVNALQNCGNKNKIENKIEIVPDVENVIEIENNKIEKIENENKKEKEKETVGNGTSSLTDTECDPTLLPMLCGVTKLKPDIRALVWGCIVTRQIQVLDAAIALNRILKHDGVASSKKGSSKKKKNEKIATKDMEKDVEKRKKSECQIVCQVLEKITKQRLGQNLAIARAVSSCCLLLVYLQLEIKWEEHSEKKKNGSIAEKGSSSSEKSKNEGLNELIVSRFDRLAVVTLSPFLQYSDVQWLSLSDKFPSGNKNERIEDASPKIQPMLENTPTVLLSPRLRKRKSDVTSDVPESEVRSLKKRKSVSGKSPSTPTTTPIEEKTKRDCLCDIVASLKLRYNGLTVIAPAIRRLSRNYRPTVGIPGEQSESDSSPYRSEYFSESPKSAKIARKSGTELDKVVAPVDRFLQILANKGPIIDSFTLRRSLSGAVRKQPMIPLSDAGVAQLLSLNSETPVPVLPILESMESAEISKASVGSSKTDGHSLKRTNSIVNVHKQSVGQRTGRVKVKNVRTSLKPDPNINSILSFTVPQRASLGSTIQKSPGSKGKSKGTSPKGSKIGRERSTSSKTSSSGVPMDSLRSTLDVLGSGGNVRRSARKRPRDETDRWRDASMSSSSSSSSGIMCDVDEVADTPLDKVRARKNRTIIPNSGGPRTLRGRSPDNHDIKDRKSSSRSSLLTGNLGITDDQPWGDSLNVGIAASKNCEAFGSESSGRKRAARKRASSPFFLPSVDLHSARYAEHSSGVTDDQTHSAGVALGMELYMDDDQAHSQSRRSPRFLRGNKENIRGLTGSTVRAIPYPIPDKGELDRGLNSGGSSFSRNVYMQPDSAAHSRRSFQSDHWFQDQSTPLTSRGRERGADAGDANFDHLKTPPDKHLRQSRQHFASPIATSRTATDEDRDSLRDRNGDRTAPLSARASDVIGYRSSPRRNLRPA